MGIDHKGKRGKVLERKEDNLSNRLLIALFRGWCTRFRSRWGLCKKGQSMIVINLTCRSTVILLFYVSTIESLHSLHPDIPQMSEISRFVRDIFLFHQYPQQRQTHSSCTFHCSRLPYLTRQSNINRKLTGSASGCSDQSLL